MTDAGTDDVLAAQDSPAPTAPADAADFWDVLRLSTQARIGLGRVGDALPSRRVLELRAAHADARDAVHEPLAVEPLAAAVASVGLGTATVVRSRAGSRSEYLRRPDLGREPEPESLAAIPRGRYQVGFVLADGLSPRALTDHGVALLEALVTELRPTLTLAPPVIAVQARVALADHLAEAMGVETVLVLIGERPGLSVADSLGLYLTHGPRPGRADADRNCISNIHPPDGLDYEQAARVAAGLVAGARRLGRSGVVLKDTSRATDLTSRDQRVIG